MELFFLDFDFEADTDEIFEVDLRLFFLYAADIDIDYSSSDGSSLL